MKPTIKPFREFARRAKRLKKKFQLLDDDLREFALSLTEKPHQGDSLGGGLYKIRLGSASKGGGKRGGFRIITYYVEQTAAGEVVYLVTIYDKSEEANILKADLLNTIQTELGQ